MTLAKALDADQRADALDHLAAGELDVLVVGGGIVGVGAALDAVTRGLKVGLVEQRDLASGTSSRSSKLVHGGLRYLEMFDFALVKEALEERGLLLTRLAPHLVRPVPFLYPLEHAWERPYVGAGRRALRRHGDDRQVRHGRAQAQARLPQAAGADGARHPDRRPARRDPLLRLPGRRRPAGDDDRPHRRQQRRARRDPHQGHRLPARGRPRRRRARPRPRGPARPRDPREGRHQRRRGVDRRGAGAHRRQGAARRRRQQGHPPRRAARTGSAPSAASSPRPRSRCSSSSRGASSGSSARPTPPWDFDLAHPAASKTDIDYLLGHVNRLLKDPLDHRDVDRRVGRAAAAAQADAQGGRDGRRPPSSPASTPSPTPCRASCWSPAAS